MLTRVLFADDQPGVRPGLKTLIDEPPDLIVVAEAGDGDQLVAVMANWQTDTCIGADLRMPNFEAVAANRHPKCHIPTPAISSIRLCMAACRQDPRIQQQE
jgi:DNA-binding NarL/FixJ family response regulator